MIVNVYRVVAALEASDHRCAAAERRDDHLAVDREVVVRECLERLLASVKFPVAA